MGRGGSDVPPGEGGQVRRDCGGGEGVRGGRHEGSPGLDGRGGGVHGLCDLQVLLHLRCWRGHLAERQLCEARDLVRQRVGLLEPLGGAGSAYEDDRRLSTMLCILSIVERLAHVCKRWSGDASRLQRSSTLACLRILCLSTLGLVQSTLDAWRDGFSQIQEIVAVITSRGGLKKPSCAV